ncbi:hypothetical protein DN069_23880 [Streptacidiphilus pinicola]|uniref:Uncharacterized protein n=1 Tax=Streptacidiphilus pinicola TaxID=2219663 RepID=A0A2X0IZ18_9ACTN|nr:hypothetical protein [Streptacidiphilus pinicola]RAG83146.1 hypothetical protein DN069_23880 [Streptacidiphilus pinicola]
MEVAEVLGVYAGLAEAGVVVWVDGGWCVDALTGTGVLVERTVRCVAPEWMFRFKTAYPPAEKDLWDVRALAEQYGSEIPATHRGAEP